MEIKINLIMCLAFLFAISSCKKDTDCSKDNPCKGQSSIKWGDDTYQLVEIGCQCWFAENLRYSGSIPEISEQSVWKDAQDTEQAGWCYYDNDPANDSIYGKLYNWFAVNTGTLCPPGWHIPSVEEWDELGEYLGGQYDAGGKMKSTTGWNSPNIGVTNESGFSGLPAGRRTRFEFALIGDRSNWWSSSEISHLKSHGRGLDTDNKYISWSISDKVLGYSARCIKN